jgi:signal transduction histidine kinase
MPSSSQRRVYLSTRGSCAETLELLAPHAAKIFAQWKRQVGDADIANLIFGEASLDIARLSKALRRASFKAFQDSVRDTGALLARHEVRLDDFMGALNGLFQVGVHYLPESRESLPRVRALWRLHGLILSIVVPSYLQHVATDTGPVRKPANDRRRDASAYVTKVYEEERRRLSRDLHDEVGHDLVLLKLYLEMIALDTEGKQFEVIRPRLTEAIGLVSHAIDSVRRLVLDLGPAIFDDLGFLLAVRTYAKQFSARTKIGMTLREGYLPQNIPMSHQVALYRLLQGALSNVLKHAFAKNVAVSLGCMKNAVLILVVQDDGVGFDITARPGGGSFGLTAMRERVEVLGGRIHIQSTRASSMSKMRGTRIEVDLPLPGGTQ